MWLWSSHDPIICFWFPSQPWWFSSKPFTHFFQQSSHREGGWGYIFNREMDHKMDSIGRYEASQMKNKWLVLPGLKEKMKHVWHHYWYLKNPSHLARVFEYQQKLQVFIHHSIQFSWPQGVIKNSTSFVLKLLNLNDFPEKSTLLNSYLGILLNSYLLNKLQQTYLPLEQIPSYGLPTL